ncbi:hypothetical protein Dimus_022835, partial [Dionaea muscipula]
MITGYRPSSGRDQFLRNAVFKIAAKMQGLLKKINRPEMEFRCFVHGQLLVGVSQRE